jgi:hypothetical protein
MHDWAEVDALAYLEVKEGVLETGHIGDVLRVSSCCAGSNAG